MKVPRLRVEPLLQKMRRYRWVLAGALLALALVVSLSWFLSLATSPARRAGRPVGLDAYGIPGVELKIVYPARLGVQARGDDLASVTVFGRALSEATTQPLELVFPLSDGSIAFVDLNGTHVPGRLKVVPGYPDALPHDLRVVHADTQLRGALLRPRRVAILPMVRVEGKTLAVPELAFEIRLESHWEQIARTFCASVVRVGTPYLVLGLIAAVVGWAYLRLSSERRKAREERLLPLYSRLREHMNLERWQDARREIEEIRLLEPRYHNVEEMDALVSAAEGAAWRREQLYNEGLQAYHARDWPSAARAFSAIEKEDGFYRDVRFLRRTAALYADLTSRDRSRRVAAAHELGQIADLIDATPLLFGLGDGSEEVADAAEQAFRRIGIGAFDILLAGLADRADGVQERAYRLIQGYGQEARDSLLAALRSGNPRITRRVARLLIELGARQELANALLTASGPHQEGIVEALMGEGIGASGVLIDVLLKAPPERQQLVINALAAVKTKADIDRHIAEDLRAAKEPAAKDLLQRALRTAAAPFRVAGDAPAVQSLPVERQSRRLESGRRPKRRSGRPFDRHST